MIILIIGVKSLSSCNVLQMSTHVVNKRNLFIMERLSSSSNSLFSQEKHLEFQDTDKITTSLSDVQNSKDDSQEGSVISLLLDDSETEPDSH